MMSLKSSQEISDTAPSILALWAVPRSMSTAFTKAISGSPGLRVLHEPYTDCYYFGPQRRSSRYGDSQLVAHVDAAAAQQCILAAADAKAGPLFIKELAFQAYHYLGDDLLQQLAHTLLIRHPLRVMASLLSLKPDFSEEELGFQPLAALFDRITSLQGKPPAILEGEEFRAHPRRILQHYCRSHGLIFSESMLSWSSGSLRPWRPHERESQQKWHATLESSRTILPPTDAWPRLQLSCRQEAMLERALAIYSRLAGQARPVLHLSGLQQR